MSVDVELIKFKITNSMAQSGAGPAITLVQKYNITDYVIDDSLSCNARMEITKPYDLGVSNASVELTRDVNNVVTIDLERMTSDTYSYFVWGLRINEFPQLAYQSANYGFLGILDLDNSYFDFKQDKWILNFNDILKTLYDCWEVWSLQDMQSWHVIDGYNLRKWLAQYNKINMADGIPYTPEDFIYVNTSHVFVESTYIELANRKQSVNGFLQMLLLHYGALMYIDGNGKLVFKNRNMTTDVPLNITNALLEDGYEGKFASNQIYDSVLVTSLFNTAEEILDGALLLYYDAGLPVYKQEYTWDYISNQPKVPYGNQMGEVWSEDRLQNKKYLDLRENHVSLDLTSPPFDTYTYKPIYLFAAGSEPGYNRQKLDYLNDYYDLMNPRPPFNCVINNNILNAQLHLLQKVRLGNVNFVTKSINKNYTEGTSVLELMQTT